MKVIGITSLVVLVLAIIIAKIVNEASRLTNFESENLQADICKKILPRFSVKNALLVNTTMSNRNGPARPSNESFYDGILREIRNTPDAEMPEYQLMKIRDYVTDNYAEDVDGLL